MTNVALDKTYSSGDETYGTITMRVVVLKPKVTAEEGGESPSDLEDGEVPLTEGENPLNSYLERPKHGHKCVVFLVNGQRHDDLDNTFIWRDLGFKYLRTRTMIAVDVDGLNREAMSQLVKGDRQGFYKGSAYEAIKNRMVATLKNDPELVRLQEDAAQHIADLRTGDEAVRQKLDALIDAHHTAAERAAQGPGEPGSSNAERRGGFGPDKSRDVVRLDQPDVGQPGSLPILTLNPEVRTIRLKPDEERVVEVESRPNEAWADLDGIEVAVEPPMPELSVQADRGANALTLQLKYIRSGDPDEEFPLRAVLRVVGRFRSVEEPRLLETRILVSDRQPPPPPPPPVLTEVPNFLRVVSRQPVPLIAGGPSAHVRVRWDGLDSLAVGAPPAWVFRARCLTLGSYPRIGFTQPSGGRFELLLDTPHGLIEGHELEFELEALGPNGLRLVTTFRGSISVPPAEPEPRRLTSVVPEESSQRRPPYVLKYVQEAEWDTTPCWNAPPWTKDDVAAFEEPNADQPLTLIINDDAEIIKEYREELVRRELEERSVQERVTRYTSHVAFHLYQMYMHQKACIEAQASDPSVRVPSDEEMKSEIGRLASTLVRLMEVSR